MQAVMHGDSSPIDQQWLGTDKPIAEQTITQVVETCFGIENIVICSENKVVSLVGTGMKVLADSLKAPSALKDG